MRSCVNVGSFSNECVFCCKHAHTNTVSSFDCFPPFSLSFRVLAYVVALVHSLILLLPTPLSLSLSDLMSLFAFFVFYFSRFCSTFTVCPYLVFLFRFFALIFSSTPVIAKFMVILFDAFIEFVWKILSRCFYIFELFAFSSYCCCCCLCCCCFFFGCSRWLFPLLSVCLFFFLF